MYLVEYTPASLAQLTKVPAPMRTQLAKRLHKLKDNPYAQADKSREPGSRERPRSR